MRAGQEERGGLGQWSGLVPGMSQAGRAGLRAYLSGETLLAHPYVRAAAFLIPMLTLTLAALLVLFAIRRRGTVSAHAVTLMFRWALAFGAVNILIYPVMTQDFWLSVIWGRLAVGGVNPYYVRFQSAMLAGLPIVESGERMTYGPLWAWISAVVSALSARPAPSPGAD